MTGYEEIEAAWDSTRAKDIFLSICIDPKSGYELYRKSHKTFLDCSTFLISPIGEPLLGAAWFCLPEPYTRRSKHLEKSTRFFEIKNAYITYEISNPSNYLNKYWIVEFFLDIGIIPPISIQQERFLRDRHSFHEVEKIAKMMCSPDSPGISMDFVRYKDRKIIEKLMEMENEKANTH